MQCEKLDENRYRLTRETRSEKWLDKPGGWEDGRPLAVRVERRKVSGLWMAYG